MDAPVSPIGAADNPDGVLADLTPMTLAPDTGKPLSSSHKTRFMLGFALNGILWTIGLSIIAGVLLPQRLKDIGVSNPEAMLGTINAATAIASLVANLAFGNFSDRSRSKLGRRSPWILFGGILSGICYFLVGVIGSPLWITVIYCVSMVGLNMMLAPLIAVLSDRIPLGMRGTLSAVYGVGTTVGFPLGSMVGAKFIANPLPGFILSGVLAALAGLAALLVWPREKSAADLPPAEGGFKELLLSFSPPKHAPDFYKAFVGRLFMLLSYQMVFAYQLYIAQNYLGQDKTTSGKTIGTMALILLGVSIVASAISGPLSDKLGRRKAPVAIASVLFAIGIAMPWLLKSTTGLYLMAAIAGFGYAVYTAVDQALNVDVLPNKENAGKDLGILNLGTTLGQMGGPLITSAIVTGTGGYSAIFPISILFAVIGAGVIMLIKGVK